MTMNEFTAFINSNPVLSVIVALVLLVLVNGAIMPNTGKRKARDAKARDAWRNIADSESVQARLDSIARDTAELTRKAESKRLTIARDGARKAKAHKAERETESLD